MISVLLVDDEPALLDVTQIYLERDGRMRVTLSESGQDALQKMESGHFDIIVTDYEMPQMNGIDLLKEVKARAPDVPVIIFTGRGREHVAIEALNLGASFYLQKGGDPKSQFAELRNMIFQAVQKRRAEEEIRSNQARLQAVIDLHQMHGATAHDLCMYALNKAIALTGSRTGFLGFVDEQESVLSIHTWSASALDTCRIRDRDTRFPLEKGGLHGEPVRKRGPVIINDYPGNGPGKQGYPEGHPPLSRYMGVPVLDGSRVVLVVGLANKESDYTGNDAQQVTLLMGSLWQILTRKRVESELVESEKRFRSYFELPLAGIAIATPDLRWRQVNRKFCEMLGYCAEELSALSWEDLTPEEDRQKESGILSRVLSGEIPLLAIEKRFRRKDGTLIDIEVSAMPVRKESGEVEYFVALVNDVSDLKKTERELLASNEQMSATLEELRVTQDSLNEYCHRLEKEEKALRQSEARFRTMVETAPSLLLIMDREGSIRYVSPHSLAFSGFSPDEFQKTGFDTIHEDDAPRVRKTISSAIQAGGGFRDLEFRAVKKDGSTWYGSASMEPLRDEMGDAAGFLVQIVDISSRKETESALRQSRERLREIVETINDVIFPLDGEGKITYASPAVTRIFGYSPENLLGRNFSDLMRPEDAAEALRRFREFTSGDHKEPLEVERQILTRSGEPRWCHISLWPLKRDGNFVGCTGTLTDIHDQKMAVDALHKSEALLQGIFRAVPLGIGLAKNRIFLHVNDQICRMTGYSSGELLGESSRCLYPSDDEFERVGREIAGRQWETGGDAIETRWVRKDGSRIAVLLSTSPIDPADPSSPIVFSVMDISAQKARWDLLVENESLLRTFVNAFPGPACLVGKTGEIFTANEAFWEHWSGGEVKPPGTPLQSLPESSLWQEIQDRVEEAFRSGRRTRFETEGHSRSFLVDICPVRDQQGTPSRVGVFFLDITDQKREQERRARFTENLSLLARITRFNAENILGALRGYLDLTEGQTDDPLLRTYVHKQKRQLGALEEVLSFFRDYPSKGMEAPCWLDVGASIRKAAGMHDLRNVTIYLDCRGLALLADPMLEMVFSALIQNSLRQADRVSRVSFSYRRAGNDLVLVCEDDGPGIAREGEESVFGRESDEKSSPELFFVREILSMNGFSIRETSNPGKGMRFEIVIPEGSYRIETGGEGESA